MTPPSQQAVTTSVQQTRLPLPDFNARVDIQTSRYSKAASAGCWNRRKPGRTGGRERADGAALPPITSTSVPQRSAGRASGPVVRASATRPARRSKPERSRRDEPIEARRQDERDEDAPAEKENSSPDAQTVSLAAATPSLKQGE
ncbi:MAG: hypothetical protein U0361_03555 [Nitrospiraceae bacterium]